jgi:hypothetical protein
MPAITRQVEQIVTAVSPALKKAIIESSQRNHRSLAREVEHALNLAYGAKPQIELR